MQPGKIFSLALAGGVLLSSLLISCSPVQAEEKSFYPVRYFHIQQIQQKTKGVLVSRPDPVDARIADLLRINDIETLEQYAEWLKNNILYHPDGKIDSWAPALETLSTGKGDCEDFALLTSAVVRVMGYQPKVLIFARGKQWHAVCVFNQNGRYVWFDNNALKTTDAQTLDEFTAYIVQRYQYPLVLELAPASRRWTVLYQQTVPAEAVLSVSSPLGAKS